MFWYNFTVKFPNSIKNIEGIGMAFGLDFEENDNGDPVLIDEIVIDENTGKEVETKVNQIKRYNLKVGRLNFNATGSNYSFVSSLLKNDKCDWVNAVYYTRASWNPDLLDSQEFFKDLSILVDSDYKKANCSITEFSFGYCSEKNLDFLKDFTDLKKLTINRNSKIVDLSALEPKYENDRCVSGFPKLEELTIQNLVTDITKVGTLTSLKKIDFSGNKINKGIEALSELTNLEYINLSNCNSLTQNRKLC